MHVTGYLHGGVKRKKAKERKAYKYMYAYDRINGIEMVDNGDKFQCLALLFPLRSSLSDISLFLQEIFGFIDLRC